MADRLTTAQRSRLMARIKSHNTSPEVLLRHRLWKEGLRYRLGRAISLPGKPDLVFMGPRVVVFVDGCFWHGCPIHGHTPKSNKAYWGTKLAKNIARDKLNNSKLVALGWLPIRLWEHEIRKDMDACVKRVTESIQLRRNHRR